jgi:hypothetical protein
LSTFTRISCLLKALPSDELFEPPPASENDPAIYSIQVGDGDEENGFVTATSVTKEPALAFDISMDSDCLEDGDLITVGLADKGKGVDPQEYGAALYDRNTMVFLAGTTSTGGSYSIELVGVHRNKGKNVDPEERRNGMAKYYEPDPSRIDFHDHLAQFFPDQLGLLKSFERKRTTDFNDGLHYDPTLPRVGPRLSWHPKISPFRFMVFLIPLVVGTVKAVLSQKGRVTTPITLEWISGVVIFLA